MLDQAEELREMFKNTNRADIEVLGKESKVISVSSGKGGVGKSNFVANLAISFTNIGKKVVIIDADLGLANIEVLFGVIPRKNLIHVLNNEITAEEALTDGPMGLKFLSGGSGLKALAELDNKQQSFLINSFKYLDSVFDIILIDTGAGVSDSVLNFVKAANQRIVLTTPEPTSIADAYALIKIIKEDSEISNDIHLVVNRVESREEGIEVYNKLKIVIEKFLNMNISCIGYLPADENLVTSVKRQEPITLLFPNSEYSKAIRALSYKMLNIELNNSRKGGVNFAKKLISLFKK